MPQVIEPPAPGTITADMAPQGQPDPAAQPVRVEIEGNGQAPQGQPGQIPEKFAGKKLGDVVEAYKNLESEHGRAKQQQKDLEHLVGVYKEAFANPQSYKQPVQDTQPSEEEVFRKEWENDPQKAVYNQTQRVAVKNKMANEQTATAVFYQGAKNDNVNYPDFAKYEPKMIELAGKYAGLVNPNKVASPETIDLLYRLAKAETVGSAVEEARNAGARQEVQRRKEIQSASFESPTPVSSTSSVRPEDMTLEQLEKQLGFVNR